MTTALDMADNWLLKNDPKLADKSAEYLLNRKIRDTHCLGCQIFEATDFPQADEKQDNEAFYQFVEKQNWLNAEVKILVLGITQDQSLAQIGQELGGISKQAVHKRLQKHSAAIQYLLTIWHGRDDYPETPAGEPIPIPCFEDKNQQFAFNFGGAQ